MIRLLHASCCIAILAGLWRSPAGVAASDLLSAPLAPSPDCIQTILRQDTAVPVADCLADVASFSAAAHTDSRGADYPLAEVQTADYRMRIHYTGGDFPDAVMANWPLSIEMNYGGSGCFPICWCWWKRATDLSHQALCSLLVTALMTALLDGNGFLKMEMVSTGAPPHPSGWSICWMKWTGGTSLTPCCFRTRMTMQKDRPCCKWRTRRSMRTGFPMWNWCIVPPAVLARLW